MLLTNANSIYPQIYMGRVFANLMCTKCGADGGGKWELVGWKMVKDGEILKNCLTF